MDPHPQTKQQPTKSLCQSGELVVKVLECAVIPWYYLSFQNWNRLSQDDGRSLVQFPAVRYHGADKKVVPVVIILQHKAEFYEWEESVGYCI